MMTSTVDNRTTTVAAMPRVLPLPLLLLALGLLLAPAPARAQTEAVVYYHTDAIGSVRMVTDATGAVVARYDYAPFGEEWPQQPPTTNPDVRQYAGKERDAETGLDYFGARYYRSQSGRFATVDPVLNVKAALTDPQRWNRYAYSLNNTLKFADPDGRSPKLAILALKAGHALYKGYDVYATVEGIVESGATLISADASGRDRLVAAGSLAGELSGAADLMRAGKTLMRAVDDSVDAARAARVGGRAVDAATPIGRSGNPLNVPRGTNTPTTIAGREFGGHAIDQMQGRGIMPSVVENAIRNGVRTPGSAAGTFQHVFENVRVITNEAGRVITVIPR